MNSSNSKVSCPSVLKRDLGQGDCPQTSPRCKSFCKTMAKYLRDFLGWEACISAPECFHQQPIHKLGFPFKIGGKGSKNRDVLKVCWEMCFQIPRPHINPGPSAQKQISVGRSSPNFAMNIGVSGAVCAPMGPSGEPGAPQEQVIAQDFLESSVTKTL